MNQNLIISIILVLILCIFVIEGESFHVYNPTTINIKDNSIACNDDTDNMPQFYDVTKGIQKECDNMDFNKKQRVINQQEVTSKRNKNMVVPAETGVATLAPYNLEDPFEEVKQIYGHGFTPYDYQNKDITFEPQIKFPSKRNVDKYASNYFLPEMPNPEPEFINEPTPLDSENVFSRDKQQYSVYSQVHPLKDVTFLVSQN